MNKKPAIDLILADYPNGLRGPGVSDPPSQIPLWNALSPSFLQVLMAFAHQYLHDDGALLMFYLDFINIKKNVLGILRNYKFKVFNEWTIINSMHLANPINLAKNVIFFLHCV